MVDAEAIANFIGELLVEDLTHLPVAGLSTHAITDISWNEETRRFYQEKAPQGLEFRNLDTLFGSVIKSGVTVRTNEPRRSTMASYHCC